MKKKYKSEALMAIHQDAKALYRIGAISPERLREFDELCLASGKEAAGAAGTTAKKPAAPVYAHLNT